MAKFNKKSIFSILFLCSLAFQSVQAGDLNPLDDDPSKITTAGPSPKPGPTSDPAPGPGPTKDADPKPKDEDQTFHSCPKDEGKTYAARDGTFFKVICSQHTIAESTPNGADKIKTVKAETFLECMDLCGSEPGCVSIDYVARPGDHVLKNCDLYKTGGGDKRSAGCATKSVDMAYTIEPPEELQPDAGVILCSTDCPFANGQIFDTNAGERFHIDCAKRHGTVALFQDIQETFKDCLNACGQLLPCHSVDYHIAKKKCYYGQHHGEPVNYTPGWASGHSLGCAGACSSKACTAAPAPEPKPDPKPEPKPEPKVEAKCPENNGKIFTKDGKKYKLWCGLINHGKNDLTITNEENLEGCITKCSDTPKCVRAIFQENPMKMCFLRTHGNLETPVTGGQGFDSAHLVV